MSTTPAPATATAVTAANSRTRRRAATVALWCAQAALAVQFVVAGTLKVTGDPLMVDMFTDIGAGQWLRYAVGALEVAGALGLLVPRLSGAAALGIAALMTGAVVTNVFVLQTSPAVPIALLLLSTVVAAARRHELRTLAATLAAVAR
jgi:putative oxidoreductase